MAKKSSPRQLAANRANAQKSTGPKNFSTCKFNALKHGLSAKMVCLPGDCLPDYEHLRLELITKYQPADLLVFKIVDQLAADMWRYERSIRDETRLIQFEIGRMAPEVNKMCNAISPDYRSAIALKSLADQSNVYTLLHRTQSRLRRNIRWSIDYLDQRPAQRPPVTHSPFVMNELSEAEQIVENEAVPINGHSGEERVEQPVAELVRPPEAEPPPPVSAKPPEKVIASSAPWAVALLCLIALFFALPKIAVAVPHKNSETSLNSLQISSLSPESPRSKILESQPLPATLKAEMSSCTEPLNVRGRH